MMETLKLIKEFTIVEKWPLFVTLFLRALISRKEVHAQTFSHAILQFGKNVINQFCATGLFLYPSESLRKTLVF